MHGLWRSIARALGLWVLVVAWSPPVAAQPAPVLPAQRPRVAVDASLPTAEHALHGRCQQRDAVLECDVVFLLTPTSTEQSGAVTLVSRTVGQSLDLRLEVVADNGLVAFEASHSVPLAEVSGPIRVGGRVALDGVDDSGPISARHPLFGASPVHTYGFVFETHGAGEVSLEHPPSWRADEATRSTSGSSTWTARDDRVDVVLHPPLSVHSGGPFLGGGCRFLDTFGTSSACHPWLQVGWEFAIPSWLLFSGSLESDFGDQLQFVPQVAAAIPLDLGGSIGVGVPIKVWRTAEMGVRLQPEIFWGPLQLGVAIDFFPWVRESVDVAFMIRGSL